MGWAKFQEDIVSRWINDNPTGGRSTNKVLSVHREALQETLGHCPNQENEMSGLKEFTMSSARPLPVIVLADVSGSMEENGKIDALNDAIAEMIATFAEEDDSQAQIHICVITFGHGGAIVHKPLQPASEAHWEPMKAIGRTPMGAAFDLARQLIENRETIPSRAYRPTIVLVSDGVPTDEWQGPLEELLKSERASKASRFAMSIGADDKNTLTTFLADNNGRIFEAHEARAIKNFFRWVTMSVTVRSRSATPNSVVIVDPTDLDEFDF